MSTARAALRQPVFRRVYLGAFASNIGTWMQNVVLAAYAQELTGSAVFVGVVIFAQLGPLLLVSPFGGLLADALDRRKLLIAAQVEQMVMSAVLGFVALGGEPDRWLLVGLVFVIGMGQAVNAPTWSALVPTLVGRDNLPGAISLNSAQLNGSRVIGPAIGGVLFPLLGPAGVFFTNAATYLFVIAALVSVSLPLNADADGLRSAGLRRLAEGLAVARRNALVARVLVLLGSFSLLCLTFVGQMPVVAEDNFGIDVRTFAYGALYATFGLGAVLGSISLGTVWSARSKAEMPRRALLAFAVVLAAFALARSPVAAYPLAFAVGFAYFVFITALSTVLQHDLDDRVRGRVMALWIMGFGGTVPVGNLLAGPVIEATSMTAVMLAGAAAAVVLARFADLRSLGARI